MEKKRLVGISLVSILEFVLGISMVIWGVYGILFNLNVSPGSESAGKGLGLFASAITLFLSPLFIITGVLTFKIKPLGRILSLFVFPISVFYLNCFLLSLLGPLLPLTFIQILQWLFVIFSIVYFFLPQVKSQFKNA